MANRIAAGLIAGATGTVALNLASYLDMLIRGRAASHMPARVAGRIADQVGVPLDFDDAASTDRAAERNRQEALGALLGMANGMGIGVAYGLLRLVLPQPPKWLAAVLLGGVAMTASDYPATRLGLTDPRNWSGTAWASDVVPHLAYGLATAVTFETVSN